MTLKNLVTITGPLAEAFPQLDPATIQHASEIMNERRTNEELRRQLLWTADYALYTVEDGKPVLYLGNGDTNPIFRNIQDATNKLIGTGNYAPPGDDIADVLKADGTIRAKLSDLDLVGRDVGQVLGGEKPGWPFFNIWPSCSYEGGLKNNAQRALAERVYGSTEKKIDDQGNEYTVFGKNMEMLDNAGIRATNFYVLDPQYVQGHVKEGSAICRVCGLDTFDKGSRFIALGQVVGRPHFGLRGVRKA